MKIKFQSVGGGEGTELDWSQTQYKIIWTTRNTRVRTRLYTPPWIVPLLDGEVIDFLGLFVYTKYMSCICLGKYN